MFRDYYKILGIELGASKKTIRGAYRGMASRWHPDKNPGKDTTEEMQLINEAYLILNDDEARVRYNQQYDRYQSEFGNRGFQAKNRSSAPSSGFQSTDETLNRWMANARQQAAVLARRSYEDLLGISGAAMSGCYQQIKYPVIILIIFIIVIAIF